MTFVQARIKVKVKLPRYFHGGDKGEGRYSSYSLTSTPDRVSNIMPQLRSTPKERTPGTHWIGGWLGLRAGLDTDARGKILCLSRGSNPGRPVYSYQI
jgi:hypothetical protein